MEFTDIHNIPCLGEDDYPAVALYMQSLATIIEEALDAQQTALEFFLDTGSIVWVATGAQSIAVGVTPGLPNLEVQLTINTIEQGTGLTTFFGTQLPALRGWYYVGANVHLVSSGVVTANSRRQLNLYASTLGINAADTIIKGSFHDWVIANASGTGDNLWAGGTVFSDGLEALSLDATVFHDNAVTLNTTLTPAARIYAVYLGDTPDIRQVI